MENELVSLQQKILDLESKLTFNKPNLPTTHSSKPTLTTHTSSTEKYPANNLNKLLANMQSTQNVFFGPEGDGLFSQPTDMFSANCVESEY